MTPARDARMAARLSIAEAAMRAELSASTVRRFETGGAASYPLALRLAAVYGCSANVFLMGCQRPEAKKSKTKKKTRVASAGRDKKDAAEASQ